MNSSLKKDEQIQPEITKSVQDTSSLKEWKDVNWKAILEDLFVRLFVAILFAWFFYDLLIFGLHFGSHIIQSF